MTGNRALFDQLVNDGDSAAWEQQWDQAIAGYARALDEFPDDTSVLPRLGFVLLAKSDQAHDPGLLAKALTVYQRAVQINIRRNIEDPLPLEKCAEILRQLKRVNEAAQAYYLAAEAFVARRDVAKAIENWTHATELDPDNLQSYSRLALAYERTNKNAEASNCCVAIARILQKQGELQKALQSAQRAAQLDSHNAAALKAVELIQKGAPLPEPERPRSSTGQLRLPTAQAFASLEAFGKTQTGKLVSGKKSNPLITGRELALAQLADLMFEIGDDDEAQPSKPGLTAVFKRATGDPFRNVKSNNRMQLLSLISQGIDLQSKGETNVALSLFEKALRTGMEHAALNILIGGAYLDMERYKEASKQFQLAAINPKFAAAAFFGLGLCYGREEKMKDAVTYLLRSLQQVDQTTVSEAQADSLSALYENFQESLTQSQSSEEDLLQIGERLVSFLSGPGWDERIKQARQQVNAQQEDGTLTPLAEMISIPGADRVMESLALIERYMAKGRLASALDEAQHAILYSPTYLPIHTRIAEILALENRTDAALAKYTVVAELYRIRGEGVRAVRMYQQMTQLAPDDLTIRAKLTQMLTAQGNIPEAIRQTLETANIHLNLADFDMARQTLNSALLAAQKPGVDKSLAALVLHKIGEIDMQRLDWRQALKAYEQLKAQNPSDGKARVALISLYFRMNQGRQAILETDDTLRHFLTTEGLPKAIALMETLLAEDDDVNLRQRLARLYQQAGRKADAIAQFDAIADAYHQAGNSAEAARTIQTIIALKPDNLDEYRQVLEQLQSSG